MTRDTVAVETPASWAISRMVSRGRKVPPAFFLIARTASPVGRHNTAAADHNRVDTIHLPANHVTAYTFLRGEKTAERDRRRGRGTGMGECAEVQGRRLYHVREGEGGLPILLIHGTPSASFRWRPVQNLISPYLNTCAFDLIGMGKSDKPLQDWDYTFENDAHLIAGLMDHLGYDKMVICGDDWGGGIALIFAALYPERTDLLISIDPVCYDVWPVPEIEAVGRAYLIDDEETFRAAMADSPPRLRRRCAP
jgi:pimeloyl-ACP methyl ester carboxylesterase